METQDVVLIIGVVTSSLVTLIGAVFAGWVALRQLPKQAQKIEQVHELTNRNFSEQKAKIDELEEEIRRLSIAAIEKSDIALSKAENSQPLPPREDY